MNSLPLCSWTIFVYWSSWHLQCLGFDITLFKGVFCFLFCPDRRNEWWFEFCIKNSFALFFQVCISFTIFSPKDKIDTVLKRPAFENYPQVLPVAAGSIGNPLKNLKIFPLKIFTSYLFEENLPEFWCWEEKKKPPTFELCIW